MYIDNFIHRNNLIKLPVYLSIVSHLFTVAFSHNSIVIRAIYERACFERSKNERENGKDKKGQRYAGKEIEGIRTKCHERGWKRSKSHSASSEFATTSTCVCMYGSEIRYRMFYS